MDRYFTKRSKSSQTFVLHRVSEPAGRSGVNGCIPALQLLCVGFRLGEGLGTIRSSQVLNTLFGFGALRVHCDD